MIKEDEKTFREMLNIIESDEESKNALLTLQLKYEKKEINFPTKLNKKEIMAVIGHIEKRHDTARIRQKKTMAARTFLGCYSCKFKWWSGYGCTFIDNKGQWKLHEMEKQCGLYEPDKRKE